MNYKLSRRARLAAGAALANLAIGAVGAQAQEVGSVSEIVVTATRQAVALDKVPLSISAYTQESMDRKGIRDIRDVVTQTPGLDIPLNVGGGVNPQRISIRGIDSNAGAATSAVYIDDTPVQTRNAALNYGGSTIPYIFDLDRVEVLRGPQGTLFGASAQGGAIRLITPTPSLTTYSAYGRARVGFMEGGDPSYEAGLAVGGPIVDGLLGFRVSLFQREDGGWIDRQSWQNPERRSENANSSHATVFRGALKFTPNDRLTVEPSLYYQNTKVDDRPLLWTRCPATVPLAPSRVPCPNGVADPEEGKFLSYDTIATPASDKFTVPALKVVADAGPVTFTSVSSYLYRHSHQTNEALYSNDRVTFGINYILPILPGRGELATFHNVDLVQRLAIQEFRAANSDPDARLRWTTGLYLSRASQKSDVPITSAHRAALYQHVLGRPLPGAQFMVDGIQLYYGQENTKEKSVAGFANVDFDVVENLTLSLGGRYSRDTLEFDVVERGPNYPGGVARASGDLQSKPFTPRVALSWQQSDDTLIYASWAKGYRTGGVNKTVPDNCAADLQRLGISEPGVFEPDETKTTEIGLKSSLLDRRLSFQAAAFHTKWSNIQQQIRLPCAFSVVANSASAVAQGGDITINFAATEALTLTAAIGYTDAHYDSTLQVGTSPIVFKGQKLVGNPWTINLSADYRFRFAERDAYLRAQYNAKTANNGPFPWQNPASVSYDPSRLEGVYGSSQLDLRAGVSVTPEIVIEAFAENALNNVSWTDNASPFNAINAPIAVGAAFRPRIVGLQVTARY